MFEKLFPLEWGVSGWFTYLRNFDCMRYNRNCWFFVYFTNRYSQSFARLEIVTASQNSECLWWTSTFANNILHIVVKELSTLNYILITHILRFMSCLWALLWCYLHKIGYGNENVRWNCFYFSQETEEVICIIEENQSMAQFWFVLGFIMSQRILHVRHCKPDRKPMTP